MTDPKGEGGLGFKDFAAFNNALLARQFWRINKNPKALWARVLKGLYFPNSTCWEARRGSSPSWIWCSLLEGRNLLQEGMRWSVGNGESIDFWKDSWVKDLTNNKVESQPPHNCNWVKVADFIDHQNHVWDMGKLRSCITEEEIRAISKIPISLTNGDDKQVWVHNNFGSFTVKSGYHRALHKVKSTKTHIVSSSYSPPKSMWTRLWAIPTAPKVCHFMWKVAKN